MSQETEHSQQSFKMMSLIRPLSLPIEVVDDREEREAVVDERPLVEGQDRLEPDVPAEQPVRGRVEETNLVARIVLKHSLHLVLIIVFSGIQSFEICFVLLCDMIGFLHHDYSN